MDELLIWATSFQVLKIEPNNEKALFRKSKVLIEKCQLDEAIGILRRVNRLYPNNKECQAELARLTSKVKAGKEKEQMLSRKMLGLDQVPLTPEKNTSLFSKQVKIALAAAGGIGALVATYLMKQYNLYWSFNIVMLSCIVNNRKFYVKRECIYPENWCYF